MKATNALDLENPRLNCESNNWDGMLLQLKNFKNCLAGVAQGRVLGRRGPIGRDLRGRKSSL